MSKSATEYMESLRGALRDNPHARAFYFPADRAGRVEGTLRLGREFGYGLAGLEDGESVIGSSYSTLVVINCFDRTGVAVDAKEWVRAIRVGMARKGLST